MLKLREMRRNKGYLPRRAEHCRYWYDVPQVTHHMHCVQFDVTQEGQVLAKQLMKPP